MVGWLSRRSTYPSNGDTRPRASTGAGLVHIAALCVHLFTASRGCRIPRRRRSTGPTLVLSPLLNSSPPAPHPPTSLTVHPQPCPPTQYSQRPPHPFHSASSCIAGLLAPPLCPPLYLTPHLSPNQGLCPLSHFPRHLHPAMGRTSSTGSARSHRPLRIRPGATSRRLALGGCLLLWLAALALDTPASVTASTPEAAALEQSGEDCGDAMTRCLSMEGGMGEDCEDCAEQCTQLAQSAEPGPGIDEDVAEEYERIARATVSRCQE